MTPHKLIEAIERLKKEFYTRKGNESVYMEIYNEACNDIINLIKDLYPEVEAEPEN